MKRQPPRWVDRCRVEFIAGWPAGHWMRLLEECDLVFGANHDDSSTEWPETYVWVDLLRMWTNTKMVPHHSLDRAVMSIRSVVESMLRAAKDPATCDEMVLLWNLGGQDAIWAVADQKLAETE